MVATSGPLPKRQATRIRRNKAADGLGITTAPGAEHIVIPEPNPAWHPLAHDWYVSLAQSGMARFYEPSDWMTAYIAASWLHSLLGERYITMQGVGFGKQEPYVGRQPLNGTEMSTFLKLAANLGATEGDRRRLRIELERGEPEEKKVTPGQQARQRAQEQLGLHVVQGGAS